MERVFSNEWRIPLNLENILVFKVSKDKDCFSESWSIRESLLYICDYLHFSSLKNTCFFLFFLFFSLLYFLSVFFFFSFSFFNVVSFWCNIRHFFVMGIPQNCQIFSVLKQVSLVHAWFFSIEKLYSCYTCYQFIFPF